MSWKLAVLHWSLTCSILLGGVESGIARQQTNSCGVSRIKNSFASRIYGGTKMPYGSSPWVVRLEENGHHKCGGSLVHTKLVLTAAHCLRISKNTDKTFEYKMIAGDYSRKFTDEYEQVRHVIRNFTHPNFDYKTLSNDLALLEADEEFVLSDYVLPACLPAHNETPFPFTKCDVSGWGFMTPTMLPDLLQTVKLPVLPQSACDHAHHSMTGMHAISTRVLCAGYMEGRRDSCEGDSGGPFSCPRYGTTEGPLILTGVVSWGVGCGEPGKPGVYTRVEPYLNWINKILETPKVYNRNPCKFNGISIPGGKRGAVRSPRYNSNKVGQINEKSVCIWNIHFIGAFLSSSSVILSFADLNIRGGNECRQENIEIYAGDEMIGVYCGSTIPTQLEVPLPTKIKIVLNSDLTVAGRGFMMKYRIKRNKEMVTGAIFS